MHHNFHDITSRINEPPKWWDENGVPRYSEFNPHECPDIYVENVALLRISCQDCGQVFDVQMSWDNSDRAREIIKDQGKAAFHYGDPPAHGCTGDSMNCIDIEVLQVWRFDVGGRTFEWQRVPELEGKIE